MVDSDLGLELLVPRRALLGQAEGEGREEVVLPDGVKEKKTRKTFFENLSGKAQGVQHCEKKIVFFFKS